MSSHQKLVVYYISEYFGILFILDINYVLIEFMLWNRKLSKGFVLRNILRDLGTYKLYFFVYNFVLVFLFFILSVNIENIQSLLLVSFLILSRHAWLVAIDR